MDARNVDTVSKSSSDQTRIFQTNVPNAEQQSQQRLCQLSQSHQATPVTSAPPLQPAAHQRAKDAAEPNKRIHDMNHRAAKPNARIPAASLLTTLLPAFIALTLTGCAYTNIQAPMDRDFNDTQLGTKQGCSSTRTVMYLVSWGDSGTKAAADNGDITTIKHADRRVFSIICGLYTKVTTVVYGD